MPDFTITRISLVTVIDKGATLANAARAAGDISVANMAGAYFGNFQLQVQYDAGPPSSGDELAKLYVMLGSAASSSNFPPGGDGTVGTDFTPDSHYLVGSYRAVDASTSADRYPSIKRVPLLSAVECRVVLVNTSGQTMDSTWQLDVILFKHGYNTS